MKLFVPPLVPFLLLVGLCLWVQFSPVEIVDGRVDSAPSRAAGLILFLSPLYLGFCFFLNAVDGSFDRAGGNLKPWLWSLAFCWVLLIVCVWLVGVTSGELGFMAVWIAGTILPMSLVRRLIGLRAWSVNGSLWSRFVASLGDI